MLEIASLTKTFHPGTPNEVRALRDVSLRLDRGSFPLIIGTNGSGKSTLLHAVAGPFLPGGRPAGPPGPKNTPPAGHFLGKNTRAGLSKTSHGPPPDTF